MLQSVQNLSIILLFWIKEFKKFAAEGQVFVYIRSVEKTIQKLKKHKLINSNNKIEVSNKIGDLI